MKIYVASSWRNARQPAVVEALRAAGHEVYDFRNPPGGTGFDWRECDPDWLKWSPATFRAGLDHPVARAGFASDHAAMEWADGVVLVLPCGRSAHLELGWFCGRGRPAWILMEEAGEPELMYLEVEATGGGICLTLDELLEEVADLPLEDDGDDNPPCFCGETNPMYLEEGLDETCGGGGMLRCRCGGDQCVCHHHGEIECPGCDDCDEPVDTDTGWDDGVQP